MECTHFGYTPLTSLTQLPAIQRHELRFVSLDAIIHLVCGNLKRMVTCLVAQTGCAWIQQVFGGVSSATTSQTRVNGGSLTHYSAPVLEPNIYNRWFRFNVIHDVGVNNVKIYINGGNIPRYDGAGRGASTHYFKFGVYAQNGASNYMESLHKLRVYSTDKPLSQNSTTRPRSEIRIRGYDYSSGVWQFQGQGFVPHGTSGVCIMQVLGANPPRATTLMVRSYNDSLSYYKAPILVPNIWGRWFQLNVIHDVEASNVKVYLDGVQVYEATGHGVCSHYFKFRVYTQNDPSYYLESQWKGVKVLKKVHHVCTIFGETK
ncbi:Citrate-binding protein, partial [Mucuna pruriens]